MVKREEADAKEDESLDTLGSVVLFWRRKGRVARNWAVALRCPRRRSIVVPEQGRAFQYSHRTHVSKCSRRSVSSSHGNQVAVNWEYLVEEKSQGLLAGGISVLELLPRQEAGKRHHGILHVHDAAQFLINVRGIDHNTSQIAE